MCENEVEKCRCKEGFDSGAMKKNFEFENFCIFGNIMKNSTLVIRYNGHLKFNNNIKMHWVFNNDWDTIHTCNMSLCDYDKNSYCGIISIKDELNISIGFTSENSKDTITQANAYSFKISQNTIDDIMKRYNFETNEALPTVKETSSNIHKLTSIFNKIKEMIASVFVKQIK